MWSAWDLRHLWTIYSRIWLPEPQPVLTGSYWPIFMDLVDLMDHHDPCKLNLERQSLQALDCWRKCSVLLRTSWEVLQLQIEKGGGERAEQTVWTTFTTDCPSSCHCRLATNRWKIICSVIQRLGVTHQYLGWSEWSVWHQTEIIFLHLANPTRFLPFFFMILYTLSWLI